MAISKPAMQATIRSALDATYGAPSDAQERDKFAEALATALLTILTSQLGGVVVVPSGSSAGSYPVVHS